MRIAKVDSGGIGFHLITIIHNEGFPTEGLNAGSSASDKERFANLKAERYWNLRECMQRGEISGLSDEALSELTSINCDRFKRENRSAVTNGPLIAASHVAPQ